jgi:hypothetical protein
MCLIVMSATGEDPAIVLIVSVALTGCVPEMDADGSMEHVGKLVAPEGPPATAHANVMVPVNPPLGVIVMMDVEELPALIADIGLPVIAKVGSASGG